MPYPREVVMSGNAGADQREEVRSRYAAAVRAVMEPKSSARGAPAGCYDGTQAGSYGCIAGALSRAEYLAGLAAAGFAAASVTFTTEAASGIHSAIIRAIKPAGS
jgi:hypothetical protein